MGAQRPVTFLTHFCIPPFPSASLPFLFLLLPGRPRGHSPKLPRPLRAGRTGRRAPLQTGSEPAPAPTPGFPRAAPPRSHGLASTCWRLHPPAKPLPLPPAKPPAGGDGNTSPLPLGTPRFALRGQGGRQAKQSAKVPRRYGALMEGILPSLPIHPPPPPPQRRSGEVGCVRPQPASAGNLGSSRASGGMLRSLGGGRWGEGR